MDELIKEASQPLYPDPIQILTIPSEEPEPQLSEEQKEYLFKREKAQRCKVIALDKMNLHPITTNTSDLSHKQKDKLLKDVEELMNRPNEYILEEFNNICLEKVFTEDYMNYPVYKRSLPIAI